MCDWRPYKRLVQFLYQERLKSLICLVLIRIKCAWQAEANHCCSGGWWNPLLPPKLFVFQFIRRLSGAVPVHLAALDLKQGTSASRSFKVEEEKRTHRSPHTAACLEGTSVCQSWALCSGHITRTPLEEINWSPHSGIKAPMKSNRAHRHGICVTSRLWGPGGCSHQCFRRESEKGWCFP